ncbi:MAG: hypothetical protein WC703_04295 [Candidatus Neomarinimicrobiota bacterium]
MTDDNQNRSFAPPTHISALPTVLHTPLIVINAPPKVLHALPTQ